MTLEENESWSPCENAYRFDGESARSKIRRFESESLSGIIGVIIILFLLLFFVGSCMGCSACFECAAACDDACGCELEDCGRDCYNDYGCGSCNDSGSGNDSSSGSSGSSSSSGCSGSDCNDSCDSCVESEGTDCGNKRGCGACAGFGDCSECGGYKVYRIKIKVGDETYEKDLDDPKDTLDIVYPNGASSKYFEFLGYFSKAVGGTCYVDSNGTTIKSFKDGLTLYGHYQEIGENNEYELRFDTGNAPYGFDRPSPIDVYVGQEITGFPEVQEIEGYTFLGWYTEDDKRVSNDDGVYTEFHLYDVDVDPKDEYTDYIILYARYEKTKLEVKIVEMIDGSPKTKEQTVKVTHGDYLWAAAKDEILDLTTKDSDYYKFLGYSFIDDESNLKQKSDLEYYVVEEPMTVYVAKRTIVTIRFDYNTDSKSYVEYKGYHGESITIANIVGDSVSSDDFNPGYKFTGWYKEKGGDSGTSVTEIEIDKDATKKTYYAHWKKQYYEIKYFYGSYEFGSLDNLTSQYKNYYYESGLSELFNPGPSDEGNFIGWSLYSDLSGKLYTQIGEKELYGNLNLYACYSNSRSVSAVIDGQTQPTGQIVTMGLTDTVACGFVQCVIKKF